MCVRVFAPWCFPFVFSCFPPLIYGLISYLAPWALGPGFTSSWFRVPLHSMV